MLRAGFPCIYSSSMHRATFPIGINIMLYIFQHAATIGAALPSGPGEPAVRVFLLLLCLVAQLFGGLPGIMMHEYEGWQISPFANPLALPASPTGAEVDEVRPQEYNNAWLRAVAYRLLFALQGFGLNCFTVGVFGMHKWALALFWTTVAIALFNPRVPFVALQSWKERRPLLAPPGTAPCDLHRQRHCQFHGLSGALRSLGCRPAAAHHGWGDD